MINSKETLKKLHKKFPLLTLDELFDILDCYVEDYKDLFWTTTNTSNPIYNTSVTSHTKPLKTYGELTAVTSAGDCQLTTGH